MTKFTLVVCTSLPLVPVIVNAYVPAGVDPTLVTVSCELPLPVTDAGLKVAVAPLGKPVALRFATPE
jgi:hypothetical protein